MSIPGAASPLFIGAAAGAAAAYQIDRSLRFNSGDTAYLDKTFSSAGNRKTFTFSCWVKRSGLTGENNILHAGNASWFRFENTDQIYIWHNGSTSVYTDAKFRDVSAWYHLVLSVDTTQSTASNRIKLYVNGTQQTLSGTQPSQNADLAWNNNVAHYIGRQQHNTSNMLNGYLAEVNFVDGTQLTATDFGEYDSDNNWNPKDCQSSLTYGTNGFYLKFADNSSAAALGTDSSGNSNTWTVNNFDPVESVGLPSGYTADSATYSGTLSNIETDDTNGITAASSHIDFDLGASYTVGTVTAKFLNGQGSASADYRIELHGNSSYTSLLANSATVSAPSSGAVQTITHDFSSTSARYLRFSYQGGGRIGTLRFLSTTGATAGNAGCDSLIDTPTNYEANPNNGGNYATLNPLISPASSHLSDGNLKIAATTTSWVQATSTIGVNSGKWYWEVLFEGTNTLIGVTSNPNSGSYIGQVTGSYGRDAGGGYYINGSNGTGYTSFASGTTLGVALDMDNGTVTLYFNGSAESTFATGLDTSKTFYAGVSVYGSTSKNTINFGQRPFSYTPPTGHLSLCTTNLADPTIADGSTAFDTKLWQGTGVAKSITGYNFSPDLVWGKARSATNTHWLMDTVRGAGKRLVSADTRAEDTPSGVLTSFNSDGFSIGTNTESNNSDGTTYVGWAWDAGSSTSSNSDGSITSNVRANASAGFSIVTATLPNFYTNYTIGHGLNATPHFIIGKNRAESNQWDVYHQDVGTGKLLRLNSANAVSNATANQDSYYPTAPTNSVFGFVGNNNTMNFVWYVFTEVAGFSAFGSYTGNGSADGPFVFTGHHARFLMIKCSTKSGEDWLMLDTARDTYNDGDSSALYASISVTDNSTSAITTDILSNGFKCIGTNAAINQSGETYLYMSFASNPFKTARAR